MTNVRLESTLSFSLTDTELDCDTLTNDSIPDKVIKFFNWSNPSSHTMALGSTQPLTKMSTRNLPGGKGRPARKAENLIAIYDLNV
jgi:hypothetical protein